jgi:5-(carboxyamino)imidazole ribonucleotide synthase
MTAPRVGILGGGQLALMLAEALVALGCDPAIYDPDPDAPARRRFALGASAPYEDRAALKAFLDGCDVVTYEFESVPASAIRAARTKTPILPSLDVLETCQHRAREKAALVRAGAPTVAFAAVRDRDALPDALAAFGYPCVVKTAAGGYDGKGQRTYRRARDVRPDDFAPGVELIVEERVELELELSCIVARRGTDVVCLPVFENVHTAHILDVTLCPARVSPAIARRAEALARRVAESLDVQGLLTVEMFVARGRAGHGDALPRTDARLYVNELAPRPHNSGHVSRIACDWSQFELHARAVLGMALPRPVRTTREVAFMANLMGDRWPTDAAATATFGTLAAQPGVREVYVYGKASARPGRKMGHVCGVSKTHADAFQKVHDLRRGAGLSGPRRVT